MITFTGSLIFGICLFISIFHIQGWYKVYIRRQEDIDDSLMVILLIVVSILWSFYHWFSHYFNY
jgi:hypothetical protein